VYPTLESRADILRMLDDLTEARKAILARCARLSADQLNDPVYAGTWSVLENLAHLAEVEEYVVRWIRKRPGVLPQEEFPPEVPADLEAVRSALDEAHAGAIAFLKANPEAVLREPCRYGRQATEQTVGGVFFHLIEHEIGHRAFVLHKLARLEGKS
jgi:uncharacterized damage-inducible protein DinB